MNSPRANHFGNPLVTSTNSVGNNKNIDRHSKAPSSPGSTFSKNDHLKPKIVAEATVSSNLMPQLSNSRGNNNQRYTLTPNTSFTEREHVSTSSQGDCSSIPQCATHETGVLVGSTITTAASTIGLPSHYPGSAGHNRIGSLGSSIFEEELQDFDDIFGRVRSTDNSLSYTDNENDSIDRRESLPPRSERLYNADDDDDLNAMSRSMPFRLTLKEHKRNLSELSATSLDFPASLLTNNHKDQHRTSSITSIGSACSISSSNHKASSIRSSSTTRSHRRSRALSSNEFQKAVLEDLEY